MNRPSRLNAVQLGIVLLVISNGLTAVVDALAKHLSPRLPSVQIAWGFLW